MKPIIVYVTVPDSAEGEAIATALVDRKLAACVNMYPIQSVFVWEGETSHESEVVMFIKTTEDKFGEIKDTVKSLHSYDLPAIVYWEIKGE
ncbi:periplasmic divalent cation tolerance protein [Methanohalophilus levihalophilus]|uniref:divalent-cation tolerance protein CutA n=1 Tax=Methanohalophilus levihalophilus TaxID=1431282 RepID=UPI001AE8D79F|nr:divalent-cation tolerance protein CutA [Methanohalophilus levihalophilus]MBP2030966.1 periplasmic divalent cation tolerance protein [Methanohalophilus levihalophilus]